MKLEATPGNSGGAFSLIELLVGIEMTAMLAAPLLSVMAWRMDANDKQDRIVNFFTAAVKGNLPWRYASRQST